MLTDSNYVVVMKISHTVVSEPSTDSVVMAHVNIVMVQACIFPGSITGEHSCNSLSLHWRFT